MRTSVLLTGLLYLVVSSVAVGAPSKKPNPEKSSPAAKLLQNFTFKQAQAGAVMNPSLVGSCSPTDDGVAGKLQCRGNDGTVAGIDLLVAPSYYFYNGRLTSMLYLYKNNGADFLTFLQAFEGKYGPACDKHSEKWESKGGATFDNEIVTWCFNTGKLKLEQLGPSLEYGIVTYDDDYSGPSKATPKDF